MGIKTRYRYLYGSAMLAMLVCLLGSAAQAATVQAISLLAEGSKQILRITMDEPIAYQVFNLEGPARLVLQFPNAKLAKGVVPLKGVGGVEQITPVQGSGGVRIEMGLAAGVTYHIAEKGNDLLLSFVAKAAQRVAATGAVLQGIEVREQGQVTALILRGQHLDANHDALLFNAGKTMVLDFWGGKSDLSKEYYTYASPRLNNVTIGAADGRLRLVMGLRAGAGDQHQIETSANKMVIRFGVVKAKSKNGTVVEAVNFQPDDRVARLVVRTNATDPVIDMQKENGKLILNVKQAHLAAGQQRTQDVRAFPGPIEQIDSYAVGKNVRIVARLREKTVVSSYQSGNVLTVTMKPQDMVASSQVNNNVLKGKNVYHGQKISFNFQNIEIRNALNMLAEMTDFNFIMSDDVQGTLTMRLIGVPWDQALDIILAAKGLGMERNGNVIRIAPLAVLQADANARKAAKQSVEDVAPLETEFITLGYASVNNVKTILQGGSVRTPPGSQGNSSGSATANFRTGGQSGGGGGGGELKLLSPRGSILLDERSNTMIITDTRERLDNIKRLIAVIDKPMQQVMIEARIVEATDSFSRDLGVKWGGKYTGSKAGTTQTVSGQAVGTNVVDLGAAVVAGSGGAIGYTLGTLRGALNLNLELSAAEQEGRLKVVSSPRVFTSNLQEAKIEENQQIPFKMTTFVGGSATVSSQFKSAKLTLQVTPQITADKRIIMTLVVNKDTPIANPIPNGAPTIDKKNILTKLLVKDGETVVLGGIYSQTTSEQVSGVPGLQDIPYIGNLFKRKRKINTRHELLIFITPTIVSDDRLPN